MKQNPKTIVNELQDPALHTQSVEKQQPRTLEAKRPLQWVRDIPDSRDYKYTLTGAKSSSVVDLRTYCSPIENQGSLGSCTGNAIAGAIELLNKRNNKTNDISRLFIYYYERLMLGTVNYDSGAYIRDGIKVTNKYGASSESLWPYIISKFRQQPAPQAIKDALKRKVTRYERVADHAGCIDALNNGYPVTIGFDVYTSFMRIGKDGVMTYPRAGETLLGGHAVLLVGYDMNKQQYIVRNSWGTGWGDGGYFYMPFQVIQNTSMSADFWVIKQVNNP